MCFFRKYNILSSIVLVLCLQNCSSSTVDEAERVNNSIYAQNLLSNINSDIKKSSTDALYSITRSATSVSNSLQKIAEIEKATHPDAKVKEALNAEKIGMANIVSIDWNGPAEPLISRLAHNSHYTFHTIGKKPTIPLLIAVNTNNSNVSTILRNIDFQIQRNASIHIYPNRKVVELRYKN